MAKSVFGLVLIGLMFIDCSSAFSFPIWSCEINSLENYADDLKNCEYSESIILNITKWSQIPKQLVDETSKIRTIYVNNTSIQSIDGKGLCQWPQLTYIDADENQITTLTDHVFEGCYDLEILNLARNNISTIHPNAFHGLNNLKQLSLAKNKISAISNGTFTPLVRLEILMLDNNQIQRINKDTFKFNRHLCILRLSYNSLTVIDPQSFEKQIELTTLDISMNPSLTEFYLEESACVRLVFVNNASLTSLRIPSNAYKLSANFNKITHLHIDPDNLLHELYIANNSLQNLNDLSFAKFLGILDVRFNNITNVDFTNLPSPNWAEIQLTDNPIKTINIEPLMKLKKLKYLSIPTHFLNTDTLGKSINESKRYQCVTDPTQENEIYIIRQVTPVPNFDISIEIPTTTSNPADTSELVERIQKPELDCHELVDLKKSVDNLCTIVIFIVIAFSLFVSIQLVVFVIKNYSLWYRSIQNFFTNQNGPQMLDKINNATGIRNQNLNI